MVAHPTVLLQLRATNHCSSQHAARQCISHTLPRLMLASQHASLLSLNKGRL